MEEAKKQERLFYRFLEMRQVFSLEELVLVFTKRKALAFESLRMKFYGGAVCA